MLLFHLPTLLILLSSLLQLTSPFDCKVTATVTFNQCAMYCWQAYDGKKDFYNFNTGNCQQRITCGPGYYNDWENNICIDEFGGYVLKEIGWVITVKEKHVLFTQLIMLNGYFVGHKIVCDVGWKSSMRTQKKNDITLLIYICDEELKDGEIYPKTHGEYFFEKLNITQQIYAIDYVFGADNMLNFFTLKMNVVLAFTGLFWFLNILACCTTAGKKAKSKLSSNKQPQTQQKLTQSQSKEVQEYLERRKEQKMKAFGDMKQFSLHGQIKEQLQLMNKIKQESAQILRKKWEKRLEKREKQKQRQKVKEQQKQKENKKQNQDETTKANGRFEFKKLFLFKKKQQKQKPPQQQQHKKTSIIQQPQMQKSKLTQKWKNFLR